MRALLTTLVLVVSTAASATCTPKFDEWGWSESGGTMDTAIAAQWCGKPGTYEHLWSVLNLDGNKDLWKEQEAIDHPETCDANGWVIRTLNAASFIEQLVWNRGAKTLGDEKQFDWTKSLIDHSSESYTMHVCEYNAPTADDPSPLNTYASNPQDDGKPTKLWYAIYAKSNVAERSSILMHELVHDWKGHISNKACTNGGSCDASYGPSNAQTWGINFLAHAVSTWVRHPVTNEWKVGHWGNATCGYLPFLSPQVRQQAADRMKSSLQKVFQTNPPPSIWPGSTFYAAGDPELSYGGVVFNADVLYGARWPCEKICDPARFEDTSPMACKVEYQPGNSYVNAQNKIACEHANALVDQGVTPSQRATVTKNFDTTVKACVPGLSDDYLDAYCDTVKSTVTTVKGIEPKWNLPWDIGSVSPDLGLLECQADYCSAFITPTWQSTSRNSCYEWTDGQSCLDTICGSLASLAQTHGETSREYFASVQCRRAFIEKESESSFTADGTCEGDYQQCKDEDAYTQWKTMKTAGQCSLTVIATAPEPSTKGMHAERAMTDLPFATSYGVHHRSHPSSQLGGTSCEGQLMICQTMRKLAAGKAIELVSLNPLFEGAKGPENLPRPPTVEQWSSRKVFQDLVQSARVAMGQVSEARTGGGLSVAAPTCGFSSSRAS